MDIFGFAVNLNWTNFPIKGTFIPFINFLLHSSPHSKTMYFVTGNSWNYINSNYYNNIHHIQPDGIREIILRNKNNIFSIPSLTQPGFHELQASDITIDQVAVNIVNTELQSPLIDSEEFASYLPENIKVIPMEDDILEQIQQARIGIELWRYFLYLILAGIIIEMLLSNAKRTKQ